MAANDRDYFKLLRESFPVATTQETFPDTAKQLASAQSAMAGLKALNKKFEKPKPGILERLFGQDEGVLTTPARFASALVLDLAGYKDENLAKYNPLEAAIRSARGEFAITGGDIVKVNDDDSLLERLGKYATAFAFDTATDPLSYVGPVGIFSKANIATQAVRQSDNILGSALKVAAETGGNADTLVDDLFRKSRLFEAADAQRRIGGAITPDSPMGLLGMSAEGVVDQAVKRKHAASYLGSLIGESFLKGGRSGIRRQLKTLLGSDVAVDKLFRELPQELAGGLFLKTPFGGRPLARVAGGLGAGGPVTEVLSGLRLGVSSTGLGAVGTKYFSGKSGELLQQVKRSLLKAEPGAAGRVTLLDYVTFKDALAEKAIKASAIRAKSHIALSGAVATAQQFGERKGQFEEQLSAFFLSPSVPLPETADDITRAAYEQAAKLRQTMREAYDEMKASGLEIGDLGPDSSPLMFTEEEMKRQARERYRTTGKGEDFAYSPTSERVAWVQYLTDPAERAKVGFSSANADNVVFLNAASVNKQLGRQAYETDAVKIAARYMAFAENTLAASRFNKVALSTGTLLRFPAETQELLKEIRLASFMDAAAKATPQARSRAKKIVDAVQTQLNEATSDSSLRKAQQKLSDERANVLRRYDEARQMADEANAAVRTANQNVEQARAQMESVLTTNAQGYGRTGVEQAVEEFRRISRNAASRLSKARRAYSEAQSEADRLASDLIVGNEGANARRLEKAADKIDEEALTVADAKANLADAQNFRTQRMQAMTAEQQASMAAYEQAVAAQVQAAERLAAARAARANASKAFAAVRKGTSLERATALDVVVEAYTEALRASKELAARIGRRPDAMTPAQRAEHEAAKATLGTARKLLNQTLGYSRKGVAGEYARKIVELADKLTDEQLRAARVISDSDALDTMIGNLEGASRETMLGAVGDLFRTYRGLRDVLTPEDLKSLSRAERRALSTTREQVVQTGKVVPRAAGEVAGVRQVGASEFGAKSVVPKGMRDMYGPDAISETLERFYRMEEDPTDWQRHLSAVYDPLMTVWKSTATVGRGPSYVMTNTVGGITNNFLGRVSLRNHRLGAAVTAETVDGLRKILKANPDKTLDEVKPLLIERLTKLFGNKMVGGRNVADLYNEFLDRGLHLTTDSVFQQQELQRLGINVPQLYQRGANVGTRAIEDTMTTGQRAITSMSNKIVNSGYMRMMSDMAQSSEIFLRFSAFLEGVERYGSTRSAMDFVTTLHFDYSDMTAAERWVKRLAPFYTWTRNNVPLQLRALFIAPDQMSKLYRANEGLKQYFGADEENQWLNDYLPDYIVEGGGFVTGLRFGGNNIAVWNKLPLMDLEKNTQVVEIGGLPILVPRFSEIPELAGPAVKTAVEFLTNRNYQYGYEYENAKELFSAQAQNLLPPLSVLKNVGRAAGLTDNEAESKAALWQLVAGAPLGATSYDEKDLRSAAYKKTLEANDQLKAAAAEAGVDLDWLRKQIQDGTPMYKIQMRIMTGQGSVLSATVREAMKEEKEPARDYAAMLRGLEKGKLVTGY